MWPPMTIISITFNLVSVSSAAVRARLVIRLIATIVMLLGSLLRSNFRTSKCADV